MKNKYLIYSNDNFDMQTPKVRILVYAYNDHKYIFQDKIKGKYSFRCYSISEVL